MRIAIARDAAFNFYYPDNLEMLEILGAELVYWSPLKNKTLPEADGLYLGGGFPEVFASELSDNKAMRLTLKAAISQGIPTYAECGGLMYLSQALVDFAGRRWEMVGAIAQTIQMTSKLTLGYRQALGQKNATLTHKNQSIIGHEFHKSTVLEPIKSPLYKLQRYWGETSEPVLEGVQQGHLQASYLHLHWGDRPELAQRFIHHAQIFRDRSLETDG